MSLVFSYSLALAAQELPQQQVTFLGAVARELELQCRQKPNDGSLWVRLGSVRTELGQLDRALEALNRAQELEPRNPEVAAQAAYVRFLRGQRKPPLEELRRLAGKFPKAPLVLYYWGVVEGLAGDSPAAERALDRAHQLNLQDPRVTLAWLEARHQRARPGDLEPALRELFQAVPQNYQVRYQYARLLLELGRPIAAVSVARPLAEQYPAWVPGRVLLARAYWAADDVLSTVFELEHLPIEKLDGDTCLILGKAKARLGHGEDALRYLQLALRKKPGLIAAERELANTYLGLGMETRAGEILRAILARFPSDYDARALQAYIWMRGGQYDRALEVFDRLARSDPSRWEAFEGLGYVAMQRGDYASAAGYLRKALEINPQDAAACEKLGEASAKLGQSDTSISYFRRAIALNPLRAEPHYMLGRVLLKTGRADEGRKELRTAQVLSEGQRAGVQGGMALAPAPHP